MPHISGQQQDLETSSFDLDKSRSDSFVSDDFLELSNFESNFDSDMSDSDSGRKIEDHPAIEDNAVNEQIPVTYQLAVTLDRLGHDGNFATPWYLIPPCFDSNGSFDEFTSRCWKIWVMHSVALDVARSNVACQAIERVAKKGFPGCVGLIDGPLHIGSECHRSWRALMMTVWIGLAHVNSGLNNEDVRTLSSIFELLQGNRTS